MTRTVWTALATVAVLTAIYAHILTHAHRGWDTWEEVDLRG